MKSGSLELEAFSFTGLHSRSSSSPSSANLASASFTSETILCSEASAALAAFEETAADDAPLFLLGCEREAYKANKKEERKKKIKKKKKNKGKQEASYRRNTRFLKRFL